MVVRQCGSMFRNRNTHFMEINAYGAQCELSSIHYIRVIGLKMIDSFRRRQYSVTFYIVSTMGMMRHGNGGCFATTFDPVERPIACLM